MPGKKRKFNISYVLENKTRRMSRYGGFDTQEEAEKHAQKFLDANPKWHGAYIIDMDENKQVGFLPGVEYNAKLEAEEA